MSFNTPLSAICFPRRAMSSSAPDLDVKRPACEYTPQAGLFLLVAITAIPEFALAAR
jgi:hypothetical protein